MTSLYEPAGRSVFGAGSDWIVAMAGGTLASILCVIAVAFLGFAMLSGRIDLRRGGGVVLGCFLLLGSGAIARGFLDMGEAVMPGTGEPEMTVVYEAAPEEPIGPASYDPYAGASLRRSRPPADR